VTGSSISVQQLSRWWGATRAVDDVSFEAAAGRMLVLLGPSGCGKSTTLRLIAGLEAATSGRVFIGGVDVTDRPPAERRLSMVFQSYALFPHLSVAENIVFGLRVRRVGAAERQQQLARVRCWSASPPSSRAASSSGWPSAARSSRRRRSA
jgi:sn-glycerol 3-phosphate transport system ATP-binding protein